MCPLLGTVVKFFVVPTLAWKPVWRTSTMRQFFASNPGQPGLLSPRAEISLIEAVAAAGRAEHSAARRGGERGTYGGSRTLNTWAAEKLLLLDQQTPGFRSQKLLLPDPLEPELPLPDVPEPPVEPPPLVVEPPPTVAPPVPLVLEPLEPVLPDEVLPDEVLPDEVLPDDVLPELVDPVVGVVGVVLSGVVSSTVASAVSSCAVAAWPVGGTRSGLELGSGATCVPPPQPATVSVASRVRMEARSLMGEPLVGERRHAAAARRALVQVALAHLAAVRADRSVATDHGRLDDDGRSGRTLPTTCSFSP